MKIFFKGRQLTESEYNLYKNNKCICCGQTREQESFECTACRRTRCRIHTDQLCEKLTYSEEPFKSRWLYFLDY